MTCSTLQAGFSSVYPLWQQMLPQQGPASVFLTPQWQETWWGQFDDGSRELCILLVGGEVSPAGIAPLVRQGDTLSFLGGTDLFDYHDFIMGPGDPAAFYGELVSCLDGERWRILDLHSLPAASPTVAHLPDLLRSKGYDVSVEVEDVVPGIALPASWDDYLAGLRKKDRHELRRKLRRLEGAGTYQVVSSTPQSLDRDVDLFLEMMRESMEEKRDFMVPEREAFFHAIVAQMQQQSYLRLSFLELGGERVASIICFDYAGRRLLYNSGYRLAYAPYSVGLLLKALSLKEAIEQGLSYFDFLRGAEPYKYHLGAQDAELYHIRAQR